MGNVGDFGCHKTLLNFDIRVVPQKFDVSRLYCMFSMVFELSCLHIRAVVHILAIWCTNAFVLRYIFYWWYHKREWILKAVIIDDVTRRNEFWKLWLWEILSRLPVWFFFPRSYVQKFNQMIFNQKGVNELSELWL